MSITYDLTGNAIKSDGGGFIPGFEYVTFSGVTTTAGSSTVYIQPNDGFTYQVAGFEVTFSTTSSSGTITINVDASTNAPGAGTAQLTGTVSLAGTANTPVSGTVITSPTTISNGSRISYTTAGTLTGLAGCVGTIILKRIS